MLIPLSQTELLNRYHHILDDHRLTAHLYLFVYFCWKYLRTCIHNVYRWQFLPSTRPGVFNFSSRCHDDDDDYVGGGGGGYDVVDDDDDNCGDSDNNEDADNDDE